MKRTFDSATYEKMGRPDLGHKMFMKRKDGTKVWGRVSLLSFCGFKGASKGLILIGIQPFKSKKILGH